MKSLVVKINNKSIDVEDFIVTFFIKPLFVVFIYFGMFSRSVGVGGLTGGMTAVLLSAALFGIAVIHMLFFSKEKGFSALAYLMVVFFFVAAITPFISALIYNVRIVHIFRFVIELGISFAIFYFVYYFVREGIITPKFIIYCFVILGGIAALQLLATVGSMENWRRLSDLGGTNYLGNTFAVSAFTYVMVLYATDFKASKKALTVVFFVIVFITLLLTGTRAGLLVFLIAIFLYQILGIKSKKFNRYIFVFGFLILIALVILSFQVNISRLFDRYSYENLQRMVSIRYSLYYGSVADLTFLEFLIGRADLSVLESLEVERFINPHNVFLSLIRFNGILPFLILFTVFVILPINYFKIYKLHYKKDRFRIMETTMIIFLAMSFVNVMASGGRFTRNFFLFFTIAYFIGYIDLLRSNPKVEKYKKMIL